MFGIESDTWITLFSAILAAATVVVIALPLLQRSEKKERYRSVIEKKRRDLFQQARQ